MLKIKSYVKVNSIAEAYELNQKKTACVLGGMVWLKMGNRNISTAIDLSGLGLEGIQETDDEFVIGCMTSLRALETDKRLNEYTQGGHSGECPSYCRSAVSKLCDSRRKYLGPLWFF